MVQYNVLSLGFLIIACNAPSAWGEIKAFSGPLPATSNYVQFSRGYLVDPGYIDLSNIIFTADANEPSKVENIYNDGDNGDDDNDGDDYFVEVDDDGEDDEYLEEADDAINDTTAYDTESPTASPIAATTNSTEEDTTETETETESEIGPVDVDEDEDEENGDSTYDEDTTQEEDESDDAATEIETLANSTSVIIDGTNVTEESYETIETNPDVDTEVEEGGEDGEQEETEVIDGDGDGDTEDASSIEDGGDVEVKFDIDADVDVEVTNSTVDGNEGEADGEVTGEDEVVVNEDETDTKGTDGEDDDDYDMHDYAEATDDGDEKDDEDEDDYNPALDEDDDVDDDGDEDDDYYASEEGGNDDEDDYYASEEGDDGDNRNLASGGGDTVIDVVFFHEPTDCAKTKEGCDWSNLGIGQRNKDGNTHWCCSEDALKDNACESDHIGRLIIDREVFGGIHRPVLVPGTGDWIGTVDDPKLFTNKGTGQYTLVMANCNDFGRNVIVNGEFIWMNRGGYLPGDLFSELHFLTFVTICYTGLLFWYAKSMMTFKDSVIGIQKWILGTIILVLIEMFFKVTDYMVWNTSGHRSDFAMYVWIIVGVLKGAISRCVLVMVSLGWGVIRDTLGDGMKNIIILGVLYSVLAFAKDVAAIIFVEDVEILSIETEREIYDIFTVLTFMVAVIDVLYYMWILDGLNATMQYLENMNQTMKLKRFLRLRLILVFSIFFGFVWSVFGIVDATMDTALLSEGQEWIIRAAWYVNYGCVLVAIALLWKPDPRAKQYAYVMELPSVGDDMVLDTCVSNEEEDDGVNVSYSDYRDDGKFTIGNAVSS